MALRFRSKATRSGVALSTSASRGVLVKQVRSQMHEVTKNYKNLVDYLIDVTPQVLIDALQPTFNKSVIYCPKDTGRLVNSGYLEIVQRGDKPRVEIGYGRGGDPEYAAAVHENLEWKHKDPTRAKWLQVALSEDNTAIQDRIVSGYRRTF